jgi:hypothetical protein
VSLTKGQYILLLVKANDEHALDFAFHLSRLFRFALNRACQLHPRVWLMLSYQDACLNIARVFIALSPRFAQSSSTHARIRPDILPNERKWKIRTSTHCVYIAHWYYHLLLHRGTTTAVQIALPVPEFMDTSS